MNDLETTTANTFEVFYDGGCPLCRREMNWLKNRDVGNRILFTDINAAAFEKESLDKSFGELMAEIHGRTPEGNWVTGVEVFRILYQTLGFRLPVAISRWPLIRPLLDVMYVIFAKYRLRITNCCEGDGSRQA